MLHGGILVLVSAIMLFTLSSRHTLDLDVMRDRNPNFVTLADGAIRNAYTLKLMNRTGQARTLTLSVGGLVARSVNVIGVGEVKGSVPLEVDADKVRTLRVLVTVAKPDLASSHGLKFTLSDGNGKESRNVAAIFVPGDVK